MNTNDRLIGSGEIADMFGVSRQRVQQLALEPDFPTPRAVLGLGRVWAERDIVRWAQRTGRELVGVET